ncbi:MAG: FAD-binding oxidoreductase [Candidatus Rokubacteria bacterium]|nr:FAD-binding oxidoreductase [Candidatus Rokubacteria bacterium]
METEIVVVGGGIAGASAAFHLASHGRRVVLLERGEIASAASGQNMGGIDSYGWGDAPDLQAHLTAGSIEIFEAVQTDHGEDIEFRRSGGLQAIRTAEEYEFERDRVETLRKRGQVAELITTREASGIEPGFSPALLGALYAPRRGQADPVKATQAFARLAERRGGRVLTHREVRAITPRADGGYAVRTSEDEIAAGALVIAAGAWCGPVGAMLDLDIPIVPVRGQMWATAPLEPRVFQTISAAESAMAWARDHGGAPPDLTHRDGRRVTRHLYGRQRRNGEIIFGGDRELIGYEATPNSAGIEVNREHAISVLPLLAKFPIARTWAGLMPFPLDGKPLIGRVPGRDNLWIVTGLASSGFGRGPMAGKLLADYLHTGTPAPVLSGADPAGRVRELARR